MTTIISDTDIWEIITQVQWYVRNAPEYETAQLIDHVVVDCMSTFVLEDKFYDRPMVRTIARTALLTIQILEATTNDD
jgi:hypothetical protein